MNLPEFIASPHTNLWIAEPGLLYYVRKSFRYRGAIDLANVETVRDGTVAGFWRFLKRYSKTVPFRVENVINRDMAVYFRRLGWRETKDYYAAIPTFYSPLFDEQFLEAIKKEEERNRF